MPEKRDVLAQLSREELVSVVERFELSVSDRRKKENLVEAVAASKKALLPEILGEYSRDRLKELCRGLGLEDGGREKSALVERLTGSEAPGMPSPSFRPKAPSPLPHGPGAAPGPPSHAPGYTRNGVIGPGSAPRHLSELHRLRAG